MTAADVLAEGRDAHTALLTDLGETCDIKRASGTAIDANDKVTTTYSTIYSGPVRLKAYRTGRAKEVGQVSIIQQRYDAELPWDATPAVQRGDVLVMTASSDSWVVGRPLTVSEIDYTGSTTCRHIQLEDRS